MKKAAFGQGLFWNDPIVDDKCTPPEPVWLRPDYLPGLAEARAFNVSLFTTEELIAAANAREPLVCDAEVFGNYFLVAFTSVASGKVVYFEMRQGGPPVDYVKLRWVLEHFLIVTFNGNFFDLPILALALSGRSPVQLKHSANLIISEQWKPWQVLKSAKIKKLNINHIDLIEVCPLQASLKIYGGRLHVPRMQDLPFPHDAELTEDQITIVRYYCINDLTATAFCYVSLKEQIDLRAEMSARYGQDLRSKSDAQIAEAVINGELMRLNYCEPERPEVPPGTRYRYNTPAFVKYETPYMREFLAKIQTIDYVVAESGAIEIPENVGEIKLNIGKATYTVGIGGLHSNETIAAHVAGPDEIIVDRDVTSYYPSIILNLGLYPQHLGQNFLQVYRSIVQRRVEAKKDAKAAKDAGNKQLEALKKAEAETLKIVVNGSFGKLGSKWSTLYAPDLLMTVTITGQLSLLMLIERLELGGFTVLSANTDGIVIKAKKAQETGLASIIAGWERDTGFATEETRYSAVYSRDVNNYIAIKTDGKTKTKGAFFNPWASPEYKYERFKKNPQTTICIEAATEFLTKGTPIQTTIRTADDVRKFVSIRNVTGGACKGGVYFGRAVRWYYAKGETGCILYAQNGKKVPDSDGARPCMDLPASLPTDIDYAWYETEAFAILEQIGSRPASGTVTRERTGLFDF